MGNLLLTTRIRPVKPSPALGFPPPKCHLSAQRCKLQFFPKIRLLFQVFPGICLPGQTLRSQFIPGGDAFTHFGMFEGWEIFGAAPAHPKQDWKTRSQQFPVPRGICFFLKSTKASKYVCVIKFNHWSLNREGKNALKQDFFSVEIHSSEQNRGSK